MITSNCKSKEHSFVIIVSPCSVRFGLLQEENPKKHMVVRLFPNEVSVCSFRTIGLNFWLRDILKSVGLCLWAFLCPLPVIR